MSHAGTLEASLERRASKRRKSQTTRFQATEVPQHMKPYRLNDKQADSSFKLGSLSIPQAAEVPLVEPSPSPRPMMSIMDMFRRKQCQNQ